MAIELEELSEKEEEIIGRLATCLYQMRWDLEENKLEPEGIWESWIDVIAETFEVDRDRISDAIFNEFYMRDMVLGNVTAIEGFWEH